jgi:MFS family permease
MEAHEGPKTDASGSVVLPLWRDLDTWRWYGFVGLFAYLIYGLGAITPYLKTDFGLSDLVVGLHSSAFALGLIVSGLVGDRIVTRFSGASLMAAAAFGEATAGAVVALVPHPVATLAAAFVMGLCGSLMLALVNASLTVRHPHHSARVLTEAQVVASLCSMSTALLLGLSVGLHFGWRPVLVLPLVAMIFGWSWRVGRRRRPSRQTRQLPVRHEPRGTRVPRPASTSPAETETSRLPMVFWLRWAVAVAVIAVEFALVFWGPNVLRIRPGLDASTASATMAFFIGGMLAGRVLGSLLFAKVAGRSMLPAGAGLAAVGTLVLSQSSGQLMSSVGLLLAGVGVANLYPIAVDAAIGTVPGRAVQAAARCSFAFGVALLAGPPVLGALADRVGILAALWTVVALAGIAAALHMVASSMQRRRRVSSPIRY